jgi:HlyD family secretion protein
MRRFQTVAPLAAACILAAACAKKPEAEQKQVVAVKVARAETMDMPVEVSAPATLFPREQASLSARLTARIRELRARKGDTVRAGQVLAVLENSDLTAARDEAHGAVESAEQSLEKTTSGTLPADIEKSRGQVEATKAALNQALQVHDRRQKLFQEGAIPQRDLMQSETDLAAAQANFDYARKSYELLMSQNRERDVAIARSTLEQARSRLDAAKANLQFTEIVAPFSGSITEQTQYPGDMAQPGAPMFTIVDLSTATARAQVPEDKAGTIRAGQSCTFRPLDAAVPESAGRVTVINKAVDAQRRTVEVWCEISKPGAAVRAGAFGTVAFHISTLPKAVVVPLAAVQFDEGTRRGSLFVVENNVAHSREVEGGEIADGKVQIKSGVRAGETVIVEGGYGLPDKAQVTIAANKPEKEDGKKE